LVFSIFGLHILSKNEYNLSYKEKISLMNEKASLETENFNLKSEVSSLNSKISILNGQIEKVDPLETFWNEKRPKADIVYKGREIPGKTETYEIDVRNFFTSNDSTIPNLPSGLSYDECAVSALRWVHNNISYVSDSSSEGYSEYWQFPFETLTLKTGDCEDGAILIANIMLKAEVPYWRIRLNAGDVKGGGHAYVTYLREADSKWYVLDWCYWYEKSLANFGIKEFKDLDKYYGIWFSWNLKYSFYTPTYDTSCRFDKELFSIV